VHRKYIPVYVYIQQDATLHSLFISGNCCTCFGWYFHPSSGAHTTVATASGICHTVTAIWRYRGKVGTGLSVLWCGVTVISSDYLKLSTCFKIGHGRLFSVCCPYPIIVIQIQNYSQQDAMFLDLPIFTEALHVSGGSSPHHQEHITVHTASGTAIRVNNTWSCMYSYVLLMMGGKTARNKYSVCKYK
jgi:hypothetical protein